MCIIEKFWHLNHTLTVFFKTLLLYSKLPVTDRIQTDMRISGAVETQFAHAYALLIISSEAKVKLW